MFCADIQQLPVGCDVDPLDRFGLFWYCLVLGGKLDKYHDP